MNIAQEAWMFGALVGFALGLIVIMVASDWKDRRELKRVRKQLEGNR